MKIYLSAPQKSSNPTDSSLNLHYGLSPSVAAAAVVQGMAAHARIYEAALRLGMNNLLFSAAELCLWLEANAIPTSMATAQRALVDTTFFRLAGQRKTGKKGRPTNLYALVKPDDVGEKLGLPLGDSWNAPEFSAVDLSSAHRYRLAILGRYMVWEDNSSRQQQIEFWGWSKPTLIRWTREVCDIIPQIKRIRSDSLNFTAPINGDEVFLYEVGQREYPRDRRYWLEVVNGAGEIRKLPCTVEIAAHWLPRLVVTICEQLPNQYRVRSAYRDAPIWEDAGLLPY
jgi:hypothetical protein